MHSPRRTAASAASHRTLPRTLATGLLTLSAVVGMSGCAAGTDPEPARTSSPVHPSPSSSSTPSTPSPSGTVDPDRWIDLEQELPTGDLDPHSRQTYEGEPRRLDDVHHQDCLDAFADGQQVPEREGEPDQGVSPWTAAETTVVPEGWKLCSPGALSSFAVPAHFTPEVEMGKGDRVYIRVLDGNGRLIGGLKDVGAGSPSRETGLLRVVDIQRLPSITAHGGETAYLRTLVVQARSGPQLLVDMVSAPFGEDPASLDVWDLAISEEGRRALVWAAVPLASPADADQVIDSRLHEVLQQMVSSFRPVRS